MDVSSSRVKVDCTTCGPQLLRPSALHVTIVGADHRVAFFCPRCTEEISKPIDQVASEFLVDRLGVHYEIVDVPAEFLEVKGGPPISPDDVMDFAMAIRGCNLRYELDVLRSSTTAAFDA